MTTFHVHNDIADTLSWSDTRLEGLLCDAETKRELTPNEIREFLNDEQASGFLYFCGCDSRNGDGSCAGHRNKTVNN